MTKTTLDDRWAAQLDRVAAVVDEIGPKIASLFEVVSGPQMAQPAPAPTGKASPPAVPALP